MEILNCISGPTAIHLIPHLISQNDSLDLAFMRKNFAGIAYDHKYFGRSKQRFDREVKALTAAMDVVIATRYHGAVFAASTGTKCIAIFFDEYYRRKMIGLTSLGVSNLLVVDAGQPFDGARARSFLSEVSAKKTIANLPSPQLILRQAINRAASGNLPL